MTKKKNPYESQNTAEIPEFLQKKEEIEAVQNQIPEETIVMNEVELEEEEMSERRNRTIKLSDKTLMIAGILMAALCLLTLFLFFSNISKSNALKAKEAEYQELVKSVSEKDATYQAQIKALQAEIDSLKNNGGSQSTPVSGDPTKETKFVVIAKEVNVRSSIDTNADNIVGQYKEGDILTVYGDLVSDNDGRQWGNVGTNKWVCIYIDNGADGYAEEYAG